MNSIAVIYQSTYGTVKAYAQQIAQVLDADLMERKNVKKSDLSKYDTIILGGGIYAGRIHGSELLRRNDEMLKSKQLVLFSVGFTPPARTDILDKVRAANFETDQLKHIRFFHFRGGIDYKRIHLLHRVLLSVRRLSISLQPEHKRTDGNKRFLSQYGKNTEWGLDSTQDLITYVKEMRSH